MNFIRELISGAESRKHHIFSEHDEKDFPLKAGKPTNFTIQEHATIPTFSELFDEALKTVQKDGTSQDQFRDKYQKPKYLDSIDYDPTISAHYKLFEERCAGFTLNKAELEMFKKNGFVVSERLGVNSFAEAYYQTYSKHLPVYVTADSILHAWHRSFDYMLQQIEDGLLYQQLHEILENMRSQILKVSEIVGNGILQQGALDADFFLCVALSLLSGKQETAAIRSQDERVKDVLEAIQTEDMMEFTLFGKVRMMDFSQFTVRGHYNKTENLKKYFKAMMWLGRIDMRIAGSEEESDPRELGSAVVLLNLLDEATFDSWRDFDRICQLFIGVTDSMTFSQLQGVMERADTTLEAIKTDEHLKVLQDKVQESSYGKQNIQSAVYETDVSPDVAQVSLPRSFTFLGQKFVMDSWALGQLCFDKVMYKNVKVGRRVPSSLDVAFSVLQNDHAVPEIHRRMTSKGVPRRDGLLYHQNLEAVRKTIDDLPEEEWSQSIYTMWLRVLRTLSNDILHKSSPFRTLSWAKKDIATQLGSWTELRHDTILYAKQSYGCMTLCEYPDGFVEPRTDFWKAMGDMASTSAALLESTSIPGGGHYASFLDRFATFMKMLEEISLRQLEQEELTADQTHFLKTVMEARYGSGGTRYLGWYPKLFLRDPEDSGRWDPLVADVFTNPPSEQHGDPGSVLHQATGNVFTCLMSVKNGSDVGVYAGPVFSYYEFQTPNAERLSDKDWREKLTKGDTPELPEWTKDYLVTGINQKASNYRHEDDSDSLEYL